MYPLMIGHAATALRILSNPSSAMVRLAVAVALGAIRTSSIGVRAHRRAAYGFACSVTCQNGHMVGSEPGRSAAAETLAYWGTTDPFRFNGAPGWRPAPLKAASLPDQPACA